MLSPLAGGSARGGRSPSSAAAATPEAIWPAGSAEWPPLERLTYEAEAIGFHLTAHPLDAYAPALRRLGVVAMRPAGASAQPGAARVKLAGNVVGARSHTRTGSRMAFLRISDSVGRVRSDAVQRGARGGPYALLAENTNVLITADLQVQGESLRITAQDVAALDQAASGVGAAIKVWLAETASVPHIRDVLARDGAGKGRVVLVPTPDGVWQVGDRAAGWVSGDATPGGGAIGLPRGAAGRGDLVLKPKVSYSRAPNAPPRAISLWPSEQHAGFEHTANPICLVEIPAQVRSR